MAGGAFSRYQVRCLAAGIGWCRRDYSGVFQTRLEKNVSILAVLADRRAEGLQGSRRGSRRGRKDSLRKATGQIESWIGIKNQESAALGKVNTATGRKQLSN